MFFTEKIDCLKKRKEIFGVVLLVILLIIAGSNKAYAAEATVNFDEDNYSIEKDTDFVVNVSIQADGNIGLYDVSLRYDATRMEYVSGAEKEEGGVITLEGTGFGNEINYTLEFKAVGAGEAGIKVKDAHINSADDETIHYTINSSATVPINIEGEETGEQSFFEQLLEEEQTQTSDNIDAINIDVPIVGSITNGDGNILYVVDLADYEPDIKLWNYKLVTDTYIEQNLTYFSDEDRNIRVLLTMDKSENFSLYAFKENTQSFYPVNEITSNGSTYYVMSPKACLNLPEELTEKELNTNTIFYGIDAEGAGGYYRYTSGGVLEKWSGDTGIKKADTSEKNIFQKGIVIAVVVSALAGFLIITVVVCLRKRRFKKKNKQQIDIFNDRVSEKRQYLFVIRELTSREIKRKYARSYLGIIWSVLNPLLTMAVMSLVFSYMFKRSIEKFPLYYLTGNIFWTLFSGATNSAMTALVDNKTLLLKAKLPKQTFVLSRIYTSLVNFGYTCVAYVSMLVIFRVKPTWTMLLFPFDVALALLFATGIGYVLSILYVFFADIKYLYSVSLTLVLYLSAIFYPVTSLPPILQKLIGYNPIYLSIYIAREAVVYNHIPHYTAWLKLAIAAVISIIIGLTVFKKKQNDVMQRV